MIRVYRLPEKLSDGFCHGGGVPITFTNVDWFGAPPEGQSVSPGEIANFIRAKSYFDPSARYLVLDERPGLTFVIEGGR